MVNLLKIETNRVVIRNLNISDLQDFYFYRSNPDVTKYQGFDTMTLEQSHNFIIDQSHKEFGKAGEWVQYGIENNKTKKIIGDCAIKLDLYDTRIAEIGITISPLEQKKGYATEVLKGIVNFLFSSAEVLRIVEIVDTENEASIALLKKVGFKLEGHFKENIFFKGAWGSEYQYALLKKEWKKF